GGDSRSSVEEGKKERKKRMKFDEFLFSHLGEMGKYQKIQFTLVCLPTIFCAMHALSWTFAGAQIAHRCGAEGEDKYGGYWTDVSNKINLTTECYDESWSPMESSAEGARCLYQQCTWRDGVECSSIVYDNSRVSQSAIGRWEIVCDRGWIKAFIQACYYVGQMAGSMTFGVLGDRIGRKKCFFVAIALQIVCGFMQSVAPTWWIYAFFRAGTGFSHPGIFVIANVIGMELVGPKYRKLASVITGLFFAVGQCILGGVAMNVRDYQWLHVATTAPALIFLSYWWLVPESARWLVSVRRFTEADQVLQKAAKTNGVTLPDEWWKQLDGEEQSKEEEEQAMPVTRREYGFLDLLKTPELRKRSLVVFYLWPVVSMVYYGLSMKSDILGGDMYVNFIVGGLIEMPALFLVYLFIDRIGRRYVLAIGYGLAGVCLLSNLLISPTTPRWISLVQLLVSRGSITATYAGIYMFSPELFPTVVRNSAMGVCSTVARVGAIAASFISMWIVERFGKVFMLIPFGSLAVIASILILIFLPETMGKALPATIEEIENTHEMVEVQLEPLTKTDENTEGDH
ncbi:hypothetical protein PENTCL1PPCAC_18061, partial [Pristionchus entomophagus]